MIIRVLLFLGVFALVGCATTARREGRAKTIRLQPGMTQAAVVRIFGQPTRTELKPAADPFGSIWSVFTYDGSTEDRLIWKYAREDVEISFVNSNRGWVVNRWESD